MLFISAPGMDLVGAGSRSDLAISGSQVAFSLIQDGRKLPIQDLKDPIQLTAPVSQEQDLLHKCLAQPDARTQLGELMAGVPACKETLDNKLKRAEQSATNQTNHLGALYTGLLSTFLRLLLCSLLEAVARL